MFDASFTYWLFPFILGWERVGGPGLDAKTEERETAGDRWSDQVCVLWTVIWMSLHERSEGNRRSVASMKESKGTGVERGWGERQEVQGFREDEEKKTTERCQEGSGCWHGHIFMSVPLPTFFLTNELAILAVLFLATLFVVLCCSNFSLRISLQFLTFPSALLAFSAFLCLILCFWMHSFPKFVCTGETRAGQVKKNWKRFSGEKRRRSITTKCDTVRQSITTRVCASTSMSCGTTNWMPFDGSRNGNKNWMSRVTTLFRYERASVQARVLACAHFVRVDWWNDSRMADCLCHIHAFCMWTDCMELSCACACWLDVSRFDCWLLVECSRSTVLSPQPFSWFEEHQ